MIGNKYTLLFVFVCFMLGIYFIISTNMKNPAINLLSKEYKEGFVSGKCPTTMIKNGNEILLYDPKLAKIPGVNPVKIGSLKEYKEYLEWQRASGIDCPVLHLEKAFDAQGNEQYEIRPSFNIDIPIGAINHDLPVIATTPKGERMLDASQDFPPYNSGSFQGFDKENQNVGKITNIDSI